MSLFGINVLTESTCGASKYKYAGEATEVQQIMFEAAQDLSQIQNGLYIADAMMESAVLFEGASQETLVEGVVKDFFQKIIDAFKKLWDKLKAWFKKMYQTLEVFFLPGKKFVEKYGKELERKTTTGYTYNGYRWNKAKVKEVIEVTSELEIQDVPVFASIAELEKAIEHSAKDLTSEQLAKLKANTIKDLTNNKGDNISEFKAFLTEGAQNGTEKEEIENFEVYSVTEMIAAVKDNKKLITALKKSETRIEKNLSNFIKGIENLRRDLSTEDKTKYSSFINNSASFMRFCASIMTSFNEVAISIAKAQNTEFVGALKGLMHYKPAKESFVAGGQGASILESAMRLF